MLNHRPRDTLLHAGLLSISLLRQSPSRRRRRRKSAILLRQYTLVSLVVLKDRSTHNLAVLTNLQVALILYVIINHGQVLRI